jgi:hypothetical protein
MGQLDVVSVLPDEPGWQDEWRQDGGSCDGNSRSHGGERGEDKKRRGGGCVGDAQRVRDEGEQSCLKSGVGEGGEAMARGGSGRCKSFLSVRWFSDPLVCDILGSDHRDGSL